MDATAGSGGPITVLPQIYTGQPEQIAKHVAELLKKASDFVGLYTDFKKAADQLSKTWSGSASQSALKKIHDSLESLTKIIGVVRKGAELLGVSGTLIKTAQAAYKAVVGAVNPIVAGLMSNPWTYGAAVALSTATSATLRAFITAIGALLKALGVVQLANQISQLATIIGDIEKLFGSKSTTPAAGGAASTAGNTAISGTPVTNPQAPAPVASASGQAVAGGTGATGTTTAPPFTQYTPPALGGGAAAPGGGAAAPGGAQDSWIPVNGGTGATPPATTLPANGATPPVSAPVTPPVSAPSNGHVIITTDLTTGHSEIQAPAGQDAKVDIDITYNGQHYTEHVNYDVANS
ncbi:WXG100 family type VII secretion target [Amycolatopsis sp. cg5]|uniref:WXG100 family type VII secretion target n=1 Tax=Amycolatopsis sp. cg5 TaxID=3238802 RepID=UPI0035245DBF